MKKILLAFFALAFTLPTFAQECTPDPQFADSIGVYPLPYLEDEGTGGIPDTACLNTYYETTFSILIDTFSFGAFNVDPDSLVITAVNNLPAGLTYACDPPNCTFYPQEPGCATIYGIPEGDTGEFSLSISGTAYDFVPFDVTFPDATIAPGEYLLYVRPEGDASCNSIIDAVQSPTAIDAISIAPNPFSGRTQLNVTSTAAGDYRFLVSDLLGKTVLNQNLRIVEGENTFTVDAQDWAKGIYIYTLGQGDRVISGKLVVE